MVAKTLTETKAALDDTRYLGKIYIVAKIKRRGNPLLFSVRLIGLEPTRIATPDPKSGASTNFATSAIVFANAVQKLCKRASKACFIFSECNQLSQFQLQR